MNEGMVEEGGVAMASRQAGIEWEIYLNAAFAKRAGGDQGGGVTNELPVIEHEDPWARRGVGLNTTLSILRNRFCAKFRLPYRYLKT